MQDSSTDTLPPLDAFQSYLLVLARTHKQSLPGLRVDPGDAVQQTLAIAHEKRRQFRGKTDRELGAWLRKILANHLTDMLRRGGREMDEQRLAGQLDQSSARLGELLTDNDVSPSQCVLQAEKLLQLGDALTSLPAEQRQAVELRYLQGMSLAEISQTMRRSAPSIAGLLQRGLRRLRELLARAGD